MNVNRFRSDLPDFQLLNPTAMYARNDNNTSQYQNVQIVYIYINLVLPNVFLCIPSWDPAMEFLSL